MYNDLRFDRNLIEQKFNIIFGGKQINMQGHEWTVFWGLFRNVTLSDNVNETQKSSCVYLRLYNSPHSWLATVSSADSSLR